MNNPALAAIRLLAVDVDGTLLTTDHRILPEVLAAFAAARAAGLMLVLASARSPAALHMILQDLDHAGPSVCFSGAWVGAIDPAAAAAQMETERTIPLPDALAIASAATEAGLAPSWHTARQWVVPALSPPIEREMRLTRQTPSVGGDFAGAGPPNKIMLIGAPDALARLRTEVTARRDAAVDAVFSHPNYLEILPRGTDKADAVQALAARHGIAPDEIAAVGDAENDIAMIRAAGFGVAMANAVAAVRAAARWVTDSNDAGGVAVLIRHLLAARAR